MNRNGEDMIKPLIEMNYTSVYYFCDIIHNVLDDQLNYLHKINEFCGNGDIQYFLAPFQKETNLHRYIDYVILSVLQEPKDEDESYEYLSYLFEEYDVEYEKYDKENDDYWNYWNNLYIGNELEELLKKLHDEIFHILFLNRDTLTRFNWMLTQSLNIFDMDRIEDEETKLLFRKKNVLKRQHLPEWVKKAIYFRDRGRCVLCNCDLSNTVSLQSNDNFDHIIPLSKGGFNDVTNIQLLCVDCNRKKSNQYIKTKNTFERWF